MTDPAVASQDLVTQLQSQINRLGELFFGTIGELQRDAHPVSINGEEVIHKPPTPYNPQERAEGFAEEFMQAVKRIKELAERIPEPPGSEHDQVARIMQLQQQSAQLSLQLQEQKVVAEVKLQQAQDIYAALAEHALKQAGKS